MTAGRGDEAYFAAGGPARHVPVLLDAVLNNADRKGGHLLPTSSGHLYGIDHGVTFHAESKLRTLLWQWAGDPVTDDSFHPAISASGRDVVFENQ